MTRLSLIFALISLLSFSGCEKDAKFMYNIDDLVGTPWGIPEILELGPGLIDGDLTAPTIFHADGHLSIGPARIDFWSVRDKRSLLIHEAQEIWFVIDLKPDLLYVEKSHLRTGAFIVRCIYRPMDAR